MQLTSAGATHVPALEDVARARLVPFAADARSGAMDALMVSPREKGAPTGGTPGHVQSADKLTMAQR